MGTSMHAASRRREEGLSSDSSCMPRRSSPSWSVFFFFQAEDGIRDYKVTGVQTCALPILGRHADRPVRGTAGARALRRRAGGLRVATVEGPTTPVVEVSDALAVAVEHRSEERRVGKECRSRWSPYH